MHATHRDVHAIRRRIHVQRIAIQTHHILQVNHRLIAFHVSGSGIKTSQHILVKLFASYRYHGSCILELQIKQHQEAHPHYQAYSPNHPSFHTAKIGIRYVYNKKESVNRPLFCIYLDICRSLVNNYATISLLLIFISTLVLSNQLLLNVTRHKFIACKLCDKAGTATSQT